MYPSNPCTVHFLNERRTRSLFCISFSHAMTTHFVIRILRSSMCFSNCSLMRYLKGLFAATPSGCTWLMHPGGTLMRTVFFFWNICLTSLVCWAWCTSATNSFPLEPGVPGLVKMWNHSSAVHFFMDHLVTQSILLKVHNPSIYIYIYSSYGCWFESFAFTLKYQRWSNSWNAITKHC